MNPSTTPQPNTEPVDEDLAEQANPGHGIPSQDPSPAAQIPLQPEEAQREVDSALLGGGVVAGMATGSAIGVAVAGPVGVVVGAVAGAVAGAFAGSVAGAVGGKLSAQSGEVGGSAAAAHEPVIEKDKQSEIANKGARP